MNDVVEAAEGISKMDVRTLLTLVVLASGVIGAAVWKLVNRHLARREREVSEMQKQFIKDRDELLKDYRADRARYEVTLKTLNEDLTKIVTQVLDSQSKSTAVISENNRIISQNNEFLRGLLDELKKKARRARKTPPSLP